jgi:hypothetical protein
MRDRGHARVAAARAGASGVHVCVVGGNVRAIGFYRRLGFETLMTDEPGGVIYLGRKLLPTRHPRGPEGTPGCDLDAAEAA